MKKTRQRRCQRGASEPQAFCVREFDTAVIWLCGKARAIHRENDPQPQADLEHGLAVGELRTLGRERAPGARRPSPASRLRRVDEPGCSGGCRRG